MPADGIRLHLDRARLLEVLPYYDKTAAEICAQFDSVYISFYKGLRGSAGARCSFEVSVGDQYGLVVKGEIVHLFAALRENMKTG